MAQQDPVTSQDKITLDIGGMTCASCSLRIEKELSHLPGVGQAEVNLALEKANIVFDPRLITPQQFVEAVTGIGYQVRQETYRVAVDGLDEAPVKARFEEEAATTEGVYKVITNAATGTATLTVLQGLGDIHKIVESLGQKGFAVSLLTDQAQDPKELERRTALRRLVFSAVLTVPLWMAMVKMFFHAGPVWITNPWLEFTLATIVQWGPGWSFTRRAYQNIRHGNANMDVLVALGTLSAWSFSTYNVFVRGPLFFDSSATVITLILVGKYLEAVAKGRTSLAIQEMLALRPTTSQVRQADGSYAATDVENIQVGEQIQIRPGDRIPVDGIIVEGRGLIDESLLTGEPERQSLEPGSKVSAGTVHEGDRAFIMEAREVGQDTMLAQIVRTVEEAQAGKAPIQRFADRVSNVFVPTVVGFAVLTFVMTGGITGHWTPALLHAVAVLVVACPCALGLATPTAVMVGSGIGARHGILYRNGEALERVSQVTRLAMDKTGTLTEGRPRVVKVFPRDGSSEESVLTYAASVEAEANHPLSRAIILGAKGYAVAAAEGVYSEEGRGVVGEAADGSGTITVGSEALLRDYGVAWPESWPDSAIGDMMGRGATVVYVGLQDRLLGAIAIADQLRDDAAQSVKRLQQAGYRVSMLTGDRLASAEAIARQVGIQDVHAELSPVDKAHIISQWQKDGEKVAMVGDGVNDAPALAEAFVGIAVASGSDIAMHTADVTLVRPEIRASWQALLVGQRTMAKIRQNLFWALGYNIVGIPLAAFGVISPALAGGAMAFSSVLVVTNSLALRRMSVDDR